MPCDVSTGILIDEAGAHRDSTSILRMLIFLSLPWPWIGQLALWVPLVIRDNAYQLFARNRGTIWKKIKQITGMGDTMMYSYRHTILGLDDLPKPLPRGWGFAEQADEKYSFKEGDKKTS